MELTYPGIYIDEKQGAGPIAGVGTSTAAFIGLAQRGVANTPVKIANWTEYTQLFGGPQHDRYTYHAVRGFFDNGGTTAYIVRVTNVQSDALEVKTKDGKVAFRLVDLEEGPHGADNALQAILAQKDNESTFSLSLQRGTQADKAETLAGLSLDKESKGYFMHVASKYVRFEPGAASPEGQLLSFPSTKLSGGVADSGPYDYAPGLAALAKLLDVSIICAADAHSLGNKQRPSDDKPNLNPVQTAILTHCEGLKDRFAILDGRLDDTKDTVGGDTGLISALRTQGGAAALYFPWLEVSDPSGTGTLSIPPCGHIAGIYARSDAAVGVHKAPANEIIRGALGLSPAGFLGDTEIGTLNKVGVNVLRTFPGQARPVVWGARTTASLDLTQWRYVNVRRLFIFVEQSLKEGLRWAVFQPNNTALWKKVERTATEFMTRVWRAGALFGDKASQAFYVKVNEELNPPSNRALGELHIEIGMAPIRPAEFIVVHIGMLEGGSQVID